jgi:uncharacterized protein YxeA
MSASTQQVHKVTYDKAYMDLLNRLSAINPRIRIAKVGDNIEIRNASDTSALAYHLIAPASAFAFLGEDVAFSNFSSFYSTLNFFQDAEIEQTSTAEIQIRKGRSISRYRFASTDLIKDAWEELDYSDPYLQFVMTQENIKQINNVIKNIIQNHKDNVLTLNGDEKSLKYTITSRVHENTYTDEIQSVEKYGKVDYALMASTFSSIPEGSYECGIGAEGSMRLTLLNTVNDIVLHIYTAEVTE